jgi:hypothetical protein
MEGKKMSLRTYFTAKAVKAFEAEVRELRSQLRGVPSKESLSCFGGVNLIAAESHATCIEMENESIERQISKLFDNKEQYIAYAVSNSFYKVNVVVAVLIWLALSVLSFIIFL